jgi:RNA polymerase-binding transcription factor
VRDGPIAARPRRERLIEGTYGRSIESGEEIPDEPLEAVPAAERTAEEQARFERHAH